MSDVQVMPAEPPVDDDAGHDHTGDPSEALDLSGLPPVWQAPQTDDRALLGAVLGSISDRIAGRATRSFGPQDVVSEAMQQQSGEQQIDPFLGFGEQPGGWGQPGYGLAGFAPDEEGRFDLSGLNPSQLRVTPGRDGVPRGLRPNAARGAALFRDVFGFEGVIGGLGTRPNPTDHDDGNAIDVMTNEDKDLGYAYLEALLANTELLEQMGVEYIIFDQVIYSRWRGYEGRRMEDRGGPTVNHEDHLHLSYN